MTVEDFLLVVTGHRPNKLGGYSQQAHSRRVSLAEAILRVQKPTRVVTGMALGWDQAVAQAAINLGIPFTAVVPFRGQDSTWPAQSQRYYRELLERADQILYTTTLDTSVAPVGKTAAGKALNDRNRHMLRLLKDNLTAGGNGVLAALHDGTPGGTGNCLRDADKLELPTENYWSSWEKYSGL